MYKSLKERILKIIEFLLEILFPLKKLEKRVQGMTQDDFRELIEAHFDEERSLFSFFRYQRPVIRGAVWQVKYRENRKIAKIFAEIIYSEILEEISDLIVFGGSTPLLVPIPMSASDKRKRGYNQTEFLGEGIAKIDEGFVKYSPNTLKKIKETKKQTGLNKKEREKNILGAFKVIGSVKNKNIILLDDVYTTGATLNEARKVLKKAGSGKVLGVVIAR